jgi:phage shock protein A
MDYSIFTVSAFVPSSIQGGGAVVGGSSFVRRRTCAVAPRAPEHPSFSLSRPSSTTTSATTLHMNLFDRFSRVVNANLNNILKNLEDPEKIMNQALEDMQVRGLQIAVLV